MNRIDIRIENYEGRGWPDGCISAAVIYIDGIRIVEFLAQFDPSICRSPKSESHYDRWIGISKGIVVPPAMAFLGDAVKEFPDLAGRVPIAACSECGMYWCDGIWTRIYFDQDYVIWSNFIMNPELNPVDLVGVPDLKFDANQYRRAFAEIREA